MAVARFASAKPLPGVATLLHTIERTALTSIVAVNTSGFTKISAWIVPAGEDSNEDAWIPYVDNVDLTNRNTFETFKIAVNVGDKIYASSVSGEVVFFINGVYDVSGRANVTVGVQEPESPQIGDIWIRDDLDPAEATFWDGTEWKEIGTVGPAGPANDLTIGTVETGEFGDPAEVTITGTSPEQTLNFVLPPGQQGPATTLTVGTVTASAPGEDAEVEITGNSPDQTINFVLPRGDVGPQGPDGLPDQDTNAGKYLTTDGTDAFWETVDALPDQTGNEGKYLTTDGTDPEWAFLSGGTAATEPPTTGLVDGSIWLDTDGEVQPPNAKLVRWVKTATAGQTSFSGASDGSATTLSYNPSSEQVFLNGVQLVRGSDYTGFDGITIVLVEPATAGDIVQIITLPFVEVSSNVLTEEQFTAKGDILTAVDSGQSTPLNLGTNGQILTVNTATTTGLQWNTPAVAVPAGVISQFAGSTAPSGYLLCLGQEVSISSFGNLYAVVATSYGTLTNGSGGAGTTHFRLPNLQGRIPVGRDSAQTEFDVLGESGGEKAVTITVQQMPSHTHVQDSHNHAQNSHSHTFSATTTGGLHTHQLTLTNNAGIGGASDTPARGAAGTGNDPNFRTGTDATGSGYGSAEGQHSHSVSGTTNSPTATNIAATATNQNTGGGLAHNNLQPYIVVNYIIKT
jgi:microcystin-dependent protein